MRTNKEGGIHAVMVQGVVSSLSASLHELHVTLEWSALALMMTALFALRFRGRRPARESPAPEDPGDRIPPGHAKTQELLLRELNHRMRNNLTTLVELIRIRKEFALTRSETEHLTQMETTLTGLSELQGLLAGARSHPVPIQTLCQTLMRTATAAAGRTCSFTLIPSAEATAVNRQQAHSLALILNELTANAFKHAARGPAPLSITLDIRETGESLSLAFRDSGPGFPRHILENPRLSTGGLGIIQDLAATNLNACVRLENAPGASICLTVPRSSLALPP